MTGETTGLITPETHKVLGLRMITDQLGLPNADVWSGDIRRAMDQAALEIGHPINADMTLCNSKDVAGVIRHQVHGPSQHNLAPPVFMNGRPDSFPEAGGNVVFPPGLNMISVVNGAVCNFAESPVIIGGDGRSVISDYSSQYCGLVHFYEVPMRSRIEQSPIIDGTVIVMFDDIRPLNYCHWLIDWIPRLAYLGARISRDDVFVATLPMTTEFQRESLRMCGFDESRIIGLSVYDVVRARELLVPSDLGLTPHPAHKVSPWALDYVRSTFGLQSAAEIGLPKRQRKIYVSRNDAGGRRILNEDAVVERLAAAGYDRVVPSEMTFREQVTTFMGASHVIGCHGAGLTNFVFTPMGSELVELFPQSFGMPTYYILAAGMARPYFTFVAGQVVPGSHPQYDDLVLDLDEFEHCCGSLLPTAQTVVDLSVSPSVSEPPHTTPLCTAAPMRQGLD